MLRLLVDEHPWFYIIGEYVDWCCDVFFFIMFISTKTVSQQAHEMANVHSDEGSLSFEQNIAKPVSRPIKRVGHREPLSASPKKSSTNARRVNKES
jgi:hypothetical protein